MSVELVVGVAIVALFLLRKRIPQRPNDTIFAVAVAEAQRAGVDPAIFLGIIEIESGWQEDAVNNTGGDAARGGAYGLTQMTLTTARAFVPDITPHELLDARTNLRVAGMLLEANAKRSRDWRDVAAMWNSGRTFDGAPSSTRDVYVPKVLEAANAYATDLSLDLGDAPGGTV